MRKTTDIELPPDIAFDSGAFSAFIHQNFNTDQLSAFHFRLLRRSIDARSKQAKVSLRVELVYNEKPSEAFTYTKPRTLTANANKVLIIGSGPAGLFAALKLIEMGIKPVILERGEDVRTRRRALAVINKHHIVPEDSNYCFGEGGAGTYSDGKLYTRSHKRGDIRRILEILVAHGAGEDILADAHPHIGTNKLPGIIEQMRKTILDAGGEIHFNTRLTDLVIHDGICKGGIDLRGNEYMANAVILATGHSARDIFYLLHNKGVAIENKPFALGVRIEHRQEVIDRIQYHCDERSYWLPAASYSLVAQVPYKGIEKGVFSFCMCPGGFIVPSATSPEEIVVNGMSPSRRDSKFANSGMVVSIDEQDWESFKQLGPLAALAYQQQIEQSAYKSVKKGQTAPAQRMVDFTEGRVSVDLCETSYQPGLQMVEMSSFLPSQVSGRLKTAFKVFGEKMRGYYTNEAQIIGVESRTSSPVKIPRSKDTFEHITVKRLFPCGEGAGYAGGIVSAAMDGERCATAATEMYAHKTC